MDLIARLLRLHQVDSQVRGLRSRLDSAQRYLRAQERQFGDVESQHEELVSRKRQLQATIANCETELASHDERIEKIRDELNSAVTNKQYTALLSELNTIKETRGGVEDKMLRDMEQVETFDGEIGELQAQMEERSKVREKANTELEERKAEIGERLTELENDRSAAADDVPPRELGIFDELSDLYDGEAVAYIEELDRRNRVYACGECNMQMPFEQVSLLLGAGDTLVQCHACSRILLIQEEMRGELAGKK